jgi:hypothetical protein
MSDDNDDKGGGGADEALKKVLAKNEELLNEVKSARQKLREFEAAEADRKAEIAKREEEEAVKSGNFEKLLAAEKSKREQEEGNALLWRSKYQERELDLGLNSALTAAGVKPELQKAASALLRGNAELSDDGQISLGGKPLADAIKAWAGSDEGKAFVANGNEGGGAPGGGGGGKDGAKTVSRAQFDKMAPDDRFAHIKAGGKVTDPTG